LDLKWGKEFHFYKKPQFSFSCKWAGNGSCEANMSNSIPLLATEAEDKTTTDKLSIFQFLILGMRRIGRRLCGRKYSTMLAQLAAQYYPFIPALLYPFKTKTQLTFL
jgi:hypothetical protein